MDKKRFVIADAINSLAPGAQWTIVDNDYSQINWLSKDIDQPDNSTIMTEIDRLQSEYDALEYQRLRAQEYPDFRDYLDGIVKQDREQVEKYIADCLAVKEKYPKPIES